MFIIFWFLFSWWILTAVNKREFLINLVILGPFKCNSMLFYIWFSIRCCLALKTILALEKTRNEKPSFCSTVGIWLHYIFTPGVPPQENLSHSDVKRCRDSSLSPLPCLFGGRLVTGKNKNLCRALGTGAMQCILHHFSKRGNVAHWALQMGRRCLKSIWDGRREEGDTLSFLLWENVGRTAFHSELKEKGAQCSGCLGSRIYGGASGVLRECR